MRSMLRLFLLSLAATTALAEDWPQFMFNAAHSGNAAEIDLDVEKLGPQGAVAMTDGIYTSPVVASGKVYVAMRAGEQTGKITTFDDSLVISTSSQLPRP